MQARIEILHGRESIRKVLQNDGWKIDRAGGEATYLARHPIITDEASARGRIRAGDPNLRPAHWWERLLFWHRFPPCSPGT
jgi:hypothetical protein